MKQVKILLYALPWLLIVILLLLWFLGFEFPGKGGRDHVEVINTRLILEKVEDLGKIELIRYNYHEIFDYQQLSMGKIRGSSALRQFDYSPDLKAVLITRGEAVGCIDLTRMQLNDIVYRHDTLIVYLPDPELCYYKLDLENTRVYDFERSSWWSRLFPDEDEMKGVIEDAFREAERQIRISALESGILEETKNNAELILRPLIEKLADKPVVFLYKPSGSLRTPELKSF
ncbi:MAG: DUF4230 domain-containing protein [Cyclobacteriaceae bacterium]|nr:DUF4230 domain-containing protein [Cyclobacteriaceae bacterium]